MKKSEWEPIFQRLQQLRHVIRKILHIRVNQNNIFYPAVMLQYILKSSLDRLALALVIIVAEDFHP